MTFPSAFLAIPASFSDDDDVGIVMNDGRLSLKRSLLGPPRRRRLAIKVYQRGLRQGHHLRPTTHQSIHERCINCNSKKLFYFLIGRNFNVPSLFSYVMFLELTEID